MSSWFNTTTSLQHVTQIPNGIPASKVVELLQAHEFYMKCNPHMTKYELIDTPKEKPTIPESRNIVAISEPECFKVTDKVHTLPAGLWDSDVVSTYEFLNVENGVFVRIRSPMSVVMETYWSARETGDDKVELVEQVSIFCSRILAGTIKSMCDSSWEGIHGTMVNKLQEDDTNREEAFGGV